MIWQRYVFRQIAKTFSFVLTAIFAIYTLMDLSIHGIRFLKGNFALYYLYSFTAHFDLFIPLAFLLATLKVLLDLMSRLELLALQCAGLSLKRLLSPLFFFAILLLGLGLIHSEYIVPKAVTFERDFKIAHSKKKKPQRLQNIVLADGSELVYHQQVGNELHDVFWIQKKSIWHMNILRDQLAIGVDHFIKTPTLVKEKSYEQLVLEIPPFEPTLPVHSRPITTLFQGSLHYSSDWAPITTHLNHKLVTAFLPLLILYLIAPFILVYSRQRNTFLLVSLSLALFIVLMTLLDALLILGENSVIHPLLAMWVLPLCSIIFSMRKFVRSL